ncbi:hypothetical protein CPB84DRAFT_1755821 [Gymnopilus junonius]|uniref:Secreted protein n=1 Tax=Gymnopilus junonius TaxID=109634 RepID=A0A9P5N7U4_GYMJU|nr:hypothetical protein CPB84DRAFT_1755821 [Gymnopilus junonius]
MLLVDLLLALCQLRQTTLPTQASTSSPVTTPNAGRPQLRSKGGGNRSLPRKYRTSTNNRKDNGINGGRGEKRQLQMNGGNGRNGCRGKKRQLQMNGRNSGNGGNGCRGEKRLSQLLLQVKWYLMSPLPNIL